MESIDPERSNDPLGVNLGRSWFLRHTSAGTRAPGTIAPGGTPIPGDMDAAPGTASVLAGVNAAWGMDVVPGDIPLETGEPG